MNELSMEVIKKFNINELKSELTKRGLEVQGKKEVLSKRLITAIQEDNDKQLSISLVKEIFLNMFEEQNKKTVEMLKAHEENVTSIINNKLSSINQRLDKLAFDINNNLTLINKIRSKSDDLTLSLETSQSIWEKENKKLKEELKNLRSDLNEKDDYLKNKVRILEDRSRRNNIRVEGIPGRENEGWEVTQEKLRNVIKEELGIESVDFEQAHRVNRNADNNDDMNSKPPTIVAKLLHYKDKQDILHEAKTRKIRRYYFKEDFSKETLEIRKRLWDEVVRLREEEGKFAVINYDRIYSRSFGQENKNYCPFIIRRIDFALI